ncbi:MFS transporter [[Haemophilus] ducreyi]|uniref:L-lactate MFS transporter n=1 Tax=Haemophilus ducreyi TaxID=730 RepID=UPI0006551ADA|nr:OFA family MFS transporter [[Haemophilus] ducreyi]AKO36750.1 MFS transporter [[Haemophilus] ducreyi]AKO38216.1 MFS transporter [[Haemophilus] ducreyi]AKO41233.1 MFS transporter [[Haemophilus] ducreyi]AKO42659.1 MFS transporter [[Haemophilus] ducreyi]
MSFLDYKSTIAPVTFNRWLVPPAALAVHLSIGQIYAYSVFNAPLTKIIGITESAADDWKLTTIGWVFSIALAVLGAYAAMFGSWMERVGPRKAMFVATICFSLGFVVAAIGVYQHNLWLLYLGNGVLGGIGLGLGYIGPVSTLMKWFPDKPGMATGLAIMGFGGGAMLASPISVGLMNFFSSETSVGIAETFLVLSVFYFIFMMFGVFTIRLPHPTWKPKGFVEHKKADKLVSAYNVGVNQAMKTLQFWLLFSILCLNVTAGIGVLGQASVMIQELFSEVSVGKQAAIGTLAAAGFVGLLSLFNMAGRFFWSSISDKIGRKNLYSIFFLLGAVLYFIIPSIGESGNKVLFVIGFCVIISMYGGGFAAIPAYLRDLFGSYQVGAIHGRVLLAWSTAAVIGPVLVNYIRHMQIDSGVPAAQAYSVTMYIMAGLLFIGFFCNLGVKAVNQKHHHQLTIKEAAHSAKAADETVISDTYLVVEEVAQGGCMIWLRWLIVTIPLLYGVSMVFAKVMELF